ncbi:DNA polymerase [Bacillus sp. OV166]|uniref:uracil-DNA glycosylase n=1 Tax=Bacillus sp. OV166 TaxID=1882763 RepID=UPI000A2AE251|nr:uracil-DNA glycosylase [Bacillus sp. OV166]SMQ78502.1 DNA polymerase [Bacillus sp. OV166]
MGHNKKLKLNLLLEKIEKKECPNCPRMNRCNPVFSMTEADIKKKIMFIAEAPGRFGAEISRIPMSGDQSGDNFEKLIVSIGLTRDDFFITNAVLCLPLDTEGNNDTPKDGEIKNCSNFLSEQIELIKPEIIITLGSSALKALSKIRNHTLKLSKDAGTIHLWNGFFLMPLYHTSPKVMNIHRNMDQQLKDYQILKEWLEFNIFKSSATNTNRANI